ncbi:serine/threonine-protein kinase [Anaerosporobacter sp.]|uniref:serine/threonine-protein kinase n=1 Tax=Anaerosporobacter sp. TaxID=1872529 RepID=UPI00286EC01A|nr:protein kinase [Anaerosporobacter sp.]
MALIEQYKLSTYKDVSVIAENSSKKISIVIEETTNKLYVKKVLPGTAYFDFFIRLASLNHKNLIKIHDVILYDDDTYVFEEYINGQTLQALLENEGIQSEDNALDYVMQVCDALIYLHDQDPPIIHRDVKPENIMLTTDGVVKLIDFDIAREFNPSAKRDTTFLGTKEYAAPEQYGYQQTDGRTDIYAMGALLHELLTGKLPQNNIIYKGSLQKVITKCLQLEPKQRYQSVLALKKALKKIKLAPYRKKGIYALSAVLSISIIIVFFSKITNSPEHTETPFLRALSEQNSEISDTISDTIEDAIEVSTQLGISGNTDNSPKEDTHTLTSKDGNFTIQMPSNWIEDNTINASADLQASNESTLSYFVLLADPKSDLEYTFEEWKEVVFATIIADEKNMVIGDEVNITINGNPAIQQTVSTVSDGIKLKLLLTYIDGQDYYGQILCGSTESSYENNLDSFETIIYSLNGL